MALKAPYRPNRQGLTHIELLLDSLEYQVNLCQKTRKDWVTSVQRVVQQHNRREERQVRQSKMQSLWYAFHGGRELCQRTCQELRRTQPLYEPLSWSEKASFDRLTEAAQEALGVVGKYPGMSVEDDSILPHTPWYTPTRYPVVTHWSSFEAALEMLKRQTILCDELQNFYRGLRTQNTHAKAHATELEGGEGLTQLAHEREEPSPEFIRAQWKTRKTFLLLEAVGRRFPDMSREQWDQWQAVRNVIVNHGGKNSRRFDPDNPEAGPQ